MLLVLLSSQSPRPHSHVSPLAIGDSYCRVLVPVASQGSPVTCVAPPYPCRFVPDVSWFIDPGRQRSFASSVLVTRPSMHRLVHS